MILIHTCDAIIIGGGPAGVMSALKLASSGWGVVLIEKGNRHRDKACGCCLNAKARLILDDAGFANDLQGIAQGDIKRVRLHGGSDSNAVFAFNDSKSGGGGLVVPRHRLDQMLLDRLGEKGVEVIQAGKAKILSISRDESRVEVETAEKHLQFRAPLLIGADGLRSKVAKAAGLEGQSPPCKTIGVSFNLKSDSSQLDKDAIEMFVSKYGYMGVVAMGEGRWHFGALLRSHRDCPHNRLKCLLHDLSATHRSLRNFRLEKHEPKELCGLQSAGPMPSRPRDITNQGVALVGDAAGYVEPFTGEGIRWALQGGVLMGESVEGATPGQWGRKQRDRYRSEWNHWTQPGHRVCSMLSFALRYPIWCRIILQGYNRERHPFQGLFDRIVAA